MNVPNGPDNDRSRIWLLANDRPASGRLGTTTRGPFRVGVPQSGYNAERNIIASLPASAERFRPVDLWRLRSALRYRLRGGIKAAESFRFADPYFPRVDLFHFFNTIAATRTPWLSTFETSLPRWGKSSPDCIADGIGMLLSPACRRLIAMSDAAMHIARLEWASHSPKDSDTLVAKTEVLLPPQAVVCTAASKPSNDVPLIGFIGRDFYRKGGLEFLTALDRLRARGVRDWRAVIVGRLDSYGDYASKTSRSDMDTALRLLARLGSHVHHQSSVSRSRVIEILTEADFFVFPTLADTFGYAVLEAQACGAVVISTNVRALPEINDRQTGFLVELELDERREVHRRDDVAIQKRRLVDSLEVSIDTALGLDLSARRSLADKATSRLAARHSPEAHAARLSQLYATALENCSPE